MKKLLLLAALLLPMSAMAWNMGGHQFGGDTKQTTKVYGGNTTYRGGDTKVEDKLQIPNPPALSAGSSNPTSPFRIYKEEQYSTPIYGETEVYQELDIFEFAKFFLTLNEAEKVWYNNLACIESEKWRKFREANHMNDCPTNIKY